MCCIMIGYSFWNLLKYLAAYIISAVNDFFNEVTECKMTAKVI